LDSAFEGSVKALLKEGIEVGYSADVRTGFKVGEKGGGYYIGFTDENFEALLGQYLREKVSTILYGSK
jgi:V/A-type H+-transporting ATPase subunit E